MKYNQEKSDIVLELLLLDIENNFTDPTVLKKYTDEIALLNRKRNHLIQDKMQLEKEVKMWKHRNNSSALVTSGDAKLINLHKLYKEGKYHEAKEGYLNLMTNNNFYDFLKINIQLCDERTREK